MGRTARVKPTTRGGKMLWAHIVENFDGNQTQFALSVDMTHGYLNHILMGRKCPSLDLASKLERRAGVPCIAWTEPVDESA